MPQCPQCKRDVSTVWGNGEYPNDSWRCQQCDDAETSKIVGQLFLFLAALSAVCGVVGSLQ